MHILLLIVSLIAFLFWVPGTLEMIVGYLLTPVLDRFAPLPDAECPSLSIIVPACNEEATVEPAMRSLLRLDYPGVEIIAVEDRSTDGTGEILDRLAGEDPRLRVLHLAELPEGWLGKNHALQRGSELATGEWLLFTDADVVYEPDMLRRVMRLVRERPCDHLVAFPRITVEGYLVEAFVSFFMTMFNFRFRTWQAPWQWAPGYVGVGAFNMLRRSVYAAIGRHEVLRLEVGDDIKLGKRVKRAGFRQGLVNAQSLFHVPWVTSLRGAVLGLEKNAFAGVGFSWPAAIVSAFGLIVASVWPVAGVFIGPPFARWLCAAVLVAMLCAAQLQRFQSRVPLLHAVAWPLTAVLFLYIIVRSGLLAERQGGIYWRGTFYPLGELRKHLT